jgi:hypothetical protein
MYMETFTPEGGGGCNVHMSLQFREVTVLIAAPGIDGRSGSVPRSRDQSVPIDTTPGIGSVATNL